MIKQVTLCIFVSSFIGASLSWGQEILIEEAVPFKGIQVPFFQKPISPSSPVRVQTLTLPFVDCFHGSSIDSTLWDYYADLHIQLGASFFAPDLGVLVFDGADSTGAGYFPSLYTTFPGYRDSIITRPIDLSGFTPADSLYFSFWLNKAYRIDTPEVSDSFLVYFRDSSLQFRQVWGVNGLFSTADTFTYVQIPILDSAFFHDQFQVVFKTYGNLNGRYDVWLLDWVYLDRNRSWGDRYPQDVGIQSFGSLPFSQGRSVPIRQWDGKLFPLNVRIHNASKNFQNGTFSYSVKEVLNNQTFTSPSSGNQSFSLNPYSSVQMVGGITDQVAWTKNAQIEFTFSISPSTSYTRNDTLILVYSLDSVWHYDDGESEAGYGLFNKGAIAQQYVVQQPDTLIAVWIQFHPSASNYQDKPFYLAVWERSNLPSTPTYTQFSRAIFTHPNRFVRYPLSQLVPVQDTFKIGIIQIDDNPIGIGFDKDINHQQDVFYERDNEWVQTQYQGTLMIAPEFASGKKGPLLALSHNQLQKRRFQVYPNPSSNFINIDLGSVQSANVLLFDSQGKLLYEMTGKQRVTIPISMLPIGLYRLHIRMGDYLETYTFLRIP